MEEGISLAGSTELSSVTAEWISGEFAERVDAARFRIWIELPSGSTPKITFWLLMPAGQVVDVGGARERGEAERQSDAEPVQATRADIMAPGRIPFQCLFDDDIS
jgi:hypothetical protein